jgi:hypothetical protein
MCSNLACMREHPGETEAKVEFAHDGRPTGFVVHVDRPQLSWLVWETLELWHIDPRKRPHGPGLHVVVDQYRVRVGGPLPGRPGKYGNFVMVIRRYANESPYAWWISPADDHGEDRP